MPYERIDTLVTRKLAGEATETEIRELQSFIEQNPELNPIVNTIIQYWNTEHTTDHEFLEATYLLHLERMKAKGVEFQTGDHSFTESLGYGKRSKKSITRIVLITISSILFLFIGIRFLSPRAVTKTEQSPLTVSTNNGSRSHIQLPDGSKVWLNAGSKLEYDKSFGNTTREVRLTGEAYFDVVRNPQKPFIVNTSAAKVKVLGTAFNVRCYPEDHKIETSLIHGSVEVTLNKRPEQTWILKPNEKLVLLNDSTAPHINEKIVGRKIPNEPVIAIKKLTYQPGENVAVEAAWAYNKLSFEDESFLEVSHKMARWYNVSFRFESDDLKDRMLHGSFTSETIGQAMEALQYSFKFKYEIKDKQVTIY